MDGKSVAFRANSDPSIVLETEKIIILKDDEGMYGDAAPSKSAPLYLQKIISSANFDPEDDSLNDSYTDTFDSSCSRNYEELVAWKNKVTEEERLSLMYKLKRTFSLRYDNRAWLHPHGTTTYEYKTIAEGRKAKLEKLKNRARHENYEYLGNHPEIQAIISLATKKLLSVLPSDPVKFLTSFFTTRLGNMEEFQHTVDAEAKKISQYHVNKMRAAGRVTIKPGSSVRSEMSGETFRPEMEGNYLKRLNIGALAQDFSFDPSSLMFHVKKKKNENVKISSKKKDAGSRKYCGCKDWKLQKNLNEKTEPTQTTTFSTLGNINDNVMLSDEEEEGSTTFGDGNFLGEMEEKEVDHGNLTTADAEIIASLLVDEFMNGAQPQPSASGKTNKA